ncbi:TVP38/TMEM64 family protein, partial [Dyella sp.]|uniref:TVP38/TMEM64 family protein n=1 Tax=Dyella sp. TaxID=1869338 RepID=UPI002B474570
MNRLRAALPLLLLIAAGIVLLASGVFDRMHPEQLVAHQQQMHADIAEHPWISRLVYIGLLILATCTGVPVTIVLILAGGFAFGVTEGTTYSSIGLTLGSLILFLASRYAFGVGSKHPPAIAEKLHHGFERHPVAYTLFLRLVPVAPFGLVTMALAWLRCSLWLFLGATWFGGTVMLIF